MSNNLGSTGLPDEYYGLPLLARVRMIVFNDKVLAEAEHAAGFADRQAAQGFRASSRFQARTTPESPTGAFVNKTS